MAKPLAEAAPEAAPEAPGPAADAVVRTSGLTKRYRGGQLAVDGLDLAVPRGSVFGFLGPNGSGKTTTIRMLLGLIDATSGTAELLGAPMPRAARGVLPRVGALIEGPALYGFLSGRDNLHRFDSADPTADPRTRTARVGAALERVGLSAAAGKRAKSYSLGMKQRLGIASALLQPRELLVLDEPTNGLDPQGMREIRALVRELAADGSTVFLSSHLLDEIEQVCSHMAVMKGGRLVAEGTVAEMSAGARGRLAVTTPDPADAVRVLKEQGLSDLKVSGEEVSGELPVSVTAGEPGEPGEPREPGEPEGPGQSRESGGSAGRARAQAPDLAELNAALVRAGVRVRAFGVARDSLEDIFVSLTGEGFNVAG